MPAFGLDGPWRENVGFAQTMEQMAGLAWLTGHSDDQPRIQRGPCDPLAGVHAAFASLVALAERDATDRGSFVECTMVEGALNAAAEQVAEFTAHGNLMQRDGNRSPKAAPQGLYPCRGHQTMEDPRWLALSVESEAQWRALLDWLGNPSWGEGLRSASLAERRAAQDKIDEHLRAFVADRDRDACIDELLAAGVPAAPLWDARLLSEHPQLVHRGFFESVDHPIVGALPTMTVPFRFESVERWHRLVAPTMGQHNREVLSALGYGDGEIEALAADDVIGTRPSRLG
jgi:crotonobetainyl-CoA:carnitine CoA-transferase CaiB-like acyl-CoA transferase